MSEAWVRVAELEDPDPLALEAKVAEPPPFPVSRLGPVLTDAVEALRQKTLAPLAILAQSALAAVNLAVQAHADVILPTGQRRPLSCYFVTVAESGERKSAVDTIALFPVREHERLLRDEYVADLGRYKNQLAVYDSERDQIEKERKKSPAAMLAGLEGLGAPPVQPLLYQLVITEPTFEGLTRQLRDGQPSIGLFSAEGGQFLGGHAMSAENKLKTAAGLSLLWDAGEVDRVRSGEGAIKLYSRRFSMHLMVQPGVARHLFGDAELLDQGFVSRMLPVAPASTAGTRMWQDPSIEANMMLDLYYAKLRLCLKTPPALTPGKTNELDPRPVPMSANATVLYKEYYNSVETRLGSGGEYRPVRGLANKLPEHAARLALSLALFEDLNIKQLDETWMAVGIELAEHYATQALCLAARQADDPDLLLASKSLKWLADRGTEFTLAELYQGGPREVRIATAARRIVGILEAHHRAFPIGQDRFRLNKREPLRQRSGG